MPRKNPLIRRQQQRGSSIVEFALAVPFLTICLLYGADCGFVLYALICTEDAARSAASRNAGGVESATDTSEACATAQATLKGLPGIAESGVCNATPLVVTSSYCSGSSACGTSAQTVDGEPAVYVKVSYSFPPVFDLPLMKNMTVTRAAEMKVRNIQ